MFWSILSGILSVSMPEKMLNFPPEVAIMVDVEDVLLGSTVTVVNTLSEL